MLYSGHHIHTYPLPDTSKPIITKKVRFSSDPPSNIPKLSPIRRNSETSLNILSTSFTILAISLSLISVVLSTKRLNPSDCSSILYSTSNSTSQNNANNSQQVLNIVFVFFISAMAFFTMSKAKQFYLDFSNSYITRSKSLISKKDINGRRVDKKYSTSSTRNLIKTTPILKKTQLRDNTNNIHGFNNNTIPQYKIVNGKIQANQMILANDHNRSIHVHHNPHISTSISHHDPIMRTYYNQRLPPSSSHILPPNSHGIQPQLNQYRLQPKTNPSNKNQVSYKLRLTAPAAVAPSLSPKSQQPVKLNISNSMSQNNNNNHNNNSNTKPVPGFEHLF